MRRFFFELFGWSFFLSLKKHPKFRKNGSNVSNLSRFDDYTPQKINMEPKKNGWFPKGISYIQECNFQGSIFNFGKVSWVSPPLSTEKPISPIPRKSSKPGVRCCNGIPTYQFKYRLVQNTTKNVVTKLSTNISYTPWVEKNGRVTLTSWWLNQPIWKNIRQIGSSPQVGIKIKDIWNHHLDNHGGLVQIIFLSFHGWFICRWTSRSSFQGVKATVWWKKHTCKQPRGV